MFSSIFGCFLDFCDDFLCFRVEFKLKLKSSRRNLRRQILNFWHISLKNNNFKPFKSNINTRNSNYKHFWVSKNVSNPKKFDIWKNFNWDCFEKGRFCVVVNGRFSHKLQSKQRALEKTKLGFISVTQDKSPFRNHAKLCKRTKDCHNGF